MILNSNELYLLYYIHPSPTFPLFTRSLRSYLFRFPSLLPLSSLFILRFLPVPLQSSISFCFSCSALALVLVARMLHLRLLGILPFTHPHLLPLAILLLLLLHVFFVPVLLNLLLLVPLLSSCLSSCPFYYSCYSYPFYYSCFSYPSCPSFPLVLFLPSYSYYPSCTFPSGLPLVVPLSMLSLLHLTTCSSCCSCSTFSYCSSWSTFPAPLPVPLHISPLSLSLSLPLHPLHSFSKGHVKLSVIVKSVVSGCMGLLFLLLCILWILQQVSRDLYQVV